MLFLGPHSGAHNDSSCSSGPDSPHPATKDHHLDGSGTPTRAQYVSATCVVFTHYSGDTASVVDEHFSRALNFSNKDSKGKFLFFLQLLYENGCFSIYPNTYRISVNIFSLYSWSCFFERGKLLIYLVYWHVT